MATYGNYKDSQIEYVGLIPSHWTTVQNKRIMHKEKRLCDPYGGQNIISLTMNGVVIRDLGAGGKMPTSFDGYQYVYPGELLMCLFDIDVTPRCVGRVFDEGVTSPAYSSFILHDNADLNYYYYYYLMLDYTKELLHLAKNLRHSLTEEQLGQIKVPLPPLPEQIAIASYLDKKTRQIDVLISEAKASIEEYKKWTSSIINDIITKGLDPYAEMVDSKVEWIGEIPADWKLMRLKLLVDHKTERAENNTNYIGLENVESASGRLIPGTKENFEAEGVSLATKKGDIIFGKLRPYLAKCAIVESDGCCSSEFIVMRSKKCEARFIKYVILSPKFIDMVNMSTYGSKMPRANWDYIGNMVIPIPPVSTQLEIANLIESKSLKIAELIKEKEQLIVDLESYKRALIFEVVTGKRKVV